MWAVGGLAPVVSGVPDGRGRVLGSGTNARLYTTSFAIPRPMSVVDLAVERHEGRLSQALELDRVSRVFDFRNSHLSSLPKPVTLKKHNSAEKESKTAWNGTEWVSPRSETSKLPLRTVVEYEE